MERHQADAANIFHIIYLFALRRIFIFTSWRLIEMSFIVKLYLREVKIERDN